MQKKTQLIIAFIPAILLSISSSAQTWLWTSQADSSSSQTASQVAVDRNNNPYYTGYCSGTRIDFEPSTGLYITGVQSDFLAKYTTNGAPVWARNDKALDPSAEVYGMSVATDRNNNVIEAGYFDDSIAFGTYHLHSVGSNMNTYLVKYDGNGNLLWATSAKASVTTNCENYAYCVATDKMNNILVAGYFQDTAYFGGTTLAAVGIDMYLAKYSPTGTLIWAKTSTIAGGGAYNYSFSVATDDSDNAYIAGAINGTVTFGATAPLVSSAEVYLAKYDSNGNARWSLNTGATPGQIFLPTAVTVDRSQNVYLGAQFTNITLVMGPSTVTDGSLSGASNSLLAKYTRNNGTCLWAACADYISQDEVNTIIESSIATDRCRNVYWSGLCSDSFGVGPVKVTVPGGALHPTVAFAYVIQLDSNGGPIAAAALANSNLNSFSNYMAVDSLSKALFVSELESPATLVVGTDTVKRYLSNSTSFISKFAVIPAIISNSHHNNDSICKGDSTTLRVISVIGTHYTWSNGKTTDSITVKPNVTTTYYVIINNGCIIDTSFVKVTVTSVSPGITSVPRNDSICRGDSILLTGTGGGTYLWSNGSTTSSIKVAPLSNTTYTLAVTSAAGCSKDTTVTVFISPLPVASITTVPANDSICKGDSALLSGNGGTSYRWSNGKTTSSIWVNPLVNTTYTLYASGAVTCSDSAVVGIKLKPVTAISAITAIKDTICPGGSSTLSVTGSGGNVTYQWSTGATTSSIHVASIMNTTKYYATVHGPCNSVKDSITVTVIPFQIPVISGTLTKCKGVKDTLTVSGGTSYLWSNGNTTTTYYTGPINADSTITVIAYNSIGCADTAKHSITITPPPGITITDTNACRNNPVTIYASVSGPGPFNYLWSPGNETNSSITVPDTGQLYTLSVTNGCNALKTVRLAPVVPSLYACCNKVILLGDDTTITAGGAKKYLWKPSIGLNCDTCATVIANPTVTTTYTVTGEDSAGCSTDTIVTIIVETPCFNLVIPNVFTPNSGGALGLDKVFYIKTENIVGWSILIFDRWGKEMFKSSNPIQYWDGNTEGGGQAPAGIYYYMLSGTCQNNTYKKDGFVQLIR